MQMYSTLKNKDNKQKITNSDGLILFGKLRAQKTWTPIRKRADESNCSTPNSISLAHPKHMAPTILTEERLGPHIALHRECANRTLYTTDSPRNSAKAHHQNHLWPQVVMSVL